MHAGFGGLHGIMLVVHWRRRTGEIVDLIHFDIERKRHVVPNQIEVPVIEQMLDVAARSGEKIVYAQHGRVLAHQPLAEMRAEKTGSSGYQRARFQVHAFNSPLRGPSASDHTAPHTLSARGPSCDYLSERNRPCYITSGHREAWHGRRLSCPRSHSLQSRWWRY